MANRMMTGLLTSLLVALLMASCVESNPQPSPGAADDAIAGAVDTIGGMDASAADTSAQDDAGQSLPDIGADGGQDVVCVPGCDGKECGDDGCGGECCGGEPMIPGDPPCCGDIADAMCSEYCPGWWGEPPMCIPPVECIQPCIIEDCPEGWTCTNYAFSGVDVAFYCFPEPLGPACQPCETDADCPGGLLWEVDRCAAVLGEVPVCVSECSAIPKLPCPPWYSCVSAETVDGKILDVCVPDPEQCETEGGGVALTYSKTGGLGGWKYEYVLSGGILTANLNGQLCEGPLSSAQSQEIDEAALAVEWTDIEASYISPENPSCCCDQFIHVLDLTLDLPDQPAAVSTTWCDDAYFFQDLPESLVAFIDTLEAMAAQLPCR